MDPLGFQFFMFLILAFGVEGFLGLGFRGIYNNPEQLRVKVPTEETRHDPDSPTPF